MLREGALDLGRALDYACQICNAVDHAHRQGVLHRDLRPANVLVSETGVAKVADFGTSRFLEIAAHGTTVIGSPPYMAPEQFHGKAVFASDIYSLGVTMYQLLTGDLPYEAPAPGQIDRLFRTDLITPPRLRNPAISKRVNDIVLKAMAPDLASRYGKASELIEDLLDTRGAVRRPGTGAAPGGRRRRRRRPALGRPRYRRASSAGCAPATRRPPRSAGSAARRSPPAPPAARSATKRSSRAVASVRTCSTPAMLPITRSTTPVVRPTTRERGPDIDHAHQRPARYRRRPRAHPTCT